MDVLRAVGFPCCFLKVAHGRGTRFQHTLLGKREACPPQQVDVQFFCGGLEAAVQPRCVLESFPFLHILACRSHVRSFYPDLPLFLRLDSFLTLSGFCRLLSLRNRSIFTPLRAASAACYRQRWKNWRRHCTVSQRWEHAREHSVNARSN